MVQGSPLCARIATKDWQASPWTFTVGMIHSLGLIEASTSSRTPAASVFRSRSSSGRLQNGNPKRRTRERKKSHEAALIPDDGKAYVFISLDAVEQRACIAWRVIDVVLRRPAAKVLPRRHQHGQSVTAENLSSEAKIPSRNLQHRATLFRSPSAWHMSR